jgi:hypothetical protein
MIYDKCIRYASCYWEFCVPKEDSESNKYVCGYEQSILTGVQQFLLEGCGHSGLLQRIQ